MIGVLRSLPQGLYWYPLLLGLAVILLRTLVAIAGRPPRRRKRQAAGVNPLDSLELLIRRAASDRHSRMELERRCIGLLLQTAGYSGYSLDNCRRYVARVQGTRAARAVEDHIGQNSPGLLHAGGREDAADHDERIGAILDAIERTTEEPVG